MNNILQQIIALFNPSPEALQLSEKQWESVIRVAREAGVLGRIAFLISQQKLTRSLPSFAQKHLTAALNYANKQASQVRYEAQQLSALLQSAKQDCLFLKGTGYVLADSVVSKGRTFADIDMLVHKQHISAVERKLRVYGWFPDEVSDYDQKYYRQWTHEIPPLRHSARGTVLDVHHNIVPPVSGKAPDIALFWQNIRATSSGCYVLRPEAMALHSLVHLFYQEDFKHGFRDLTDLYLLFLSEGKDMAFWRRLMALAKATGFERELFYAVRYTRLILRHKFSTEITAPLEQYRPGRLTLKCADEIFLRVLRPHHSLVSGKGLPLAKAGAFLRGHLLKMPLSVLLFHTCSKGFNSLRFLLTGADKQNLAKGTGKTTK